MVRTQNAIRNMGNINIDEDVRVSTYVIIVIIFMKFRFVLFRHSRIFTYLKCVSNRVKTQKDLVNI